MFITSGTDICILYAISYCAIRERISGPGIPGTVHDYFVDRVNGSLAQIPVHPSGSLINNTGSPSPLHCTPWYTLGKKPLPHTLLPHRVIAADVNTTKPGKFLFSEPSHKLPMNQYSACPILVNRYALITGRCMIKLVGGYRV
jgi:hypothetical protein